MNFKEYARSVMSEDGIKGVTPDDRKGQRERKTRDHTKEPSIFDAKFDTKKNSGILNVLAGKFAKFFKSEMAGESGKVSNIAKKIQALGLNDHRKGGRSMAMFYLRVLNDILFDGNGNRYDMGDETDAYESKSRLQEISPAYPVMFLLGNDLMHGREPANTGVHSLVDAMADLASKIGVDKAQDLYKNKANLSRSYFKTKIDNDHLQGIFTDYYNKSNKGKLTDGDIIGIAPKEYQSSYHGDEAQGDDKEGSDGSDIASALPDEIKSNPVLSKLATELISASKDSRGTKREPGFRNAVKSHDAIAMNYVRKYLDDPKTIDGIFGVLRKYGKGNPSIFNAKDKNGDIMTTVMDKHGSGAVAQLVKKYKIDFDMSKLKALSQASSNTPNSSEAGSTLNKLKGSGVKANSAQMAPDEIKALKTELQSMESSRRLGPVMKKYAGKKLSVADAKDLEAFGAKLAQAASYPFPAGNFNGRLAAMTEGYQYTTFIENFEYSLED